MPRMLVAYASKMGGTRELAAALAGTLESRGMDVELVDARGFRAPIDHDGVVVGSALYAGRWRPESIRLLRRMSASRVRCPVWVFHSGPLGDEAAGDSKPLPDNVETILAGLDVHSTVTFGGRLPAHPSGMIARMMARTQAGDWRDFPAVAAWADGIADTVERMGAFPESHPTDQKHVIS